MASRRTFMSSSIITETLIFLKNLMLPLKMIAFFVLVAIRPSHHYAVPSTSSSPKSSRNKNFDYMSAFFLHFFSTDTPGPAHMILSDT